MNDSAKGGKPHSWNFFRAGGFDQVKLGNGADLLALDGLDQKLWVALSCPVQGLNIDPNTLQIIDADKDGRIRATDLIRTVNWACALLKDPDLLFDPQDRIRLDAIDESSPEGKQIVAAARRILASLGKPEAEKIALEDTSDSAKVFSQTNFNGDGILPADAADEPVRSVIRDMIDCLGSQTDRSGKPGVMQEEADRFFEECRSFAQWQEKSVESPDILPLGDKTADAAVALEAVRAKIDDYFARCRLAAFDERALQALNREEKDYLTFAAKDLTISSDEIAALPLARIQAGKALLLQGKVNPAWADALARMRSLAVVPLLGEKGELTEDNWNELKARFEPFRVWAASKPATAVEKLGWPRIKEILAGENQSAINKLIADDKALESEFNAMASVDLLIRLRRDLVKLLNNFVAFPDFYRRKEKAIFQAGTLYLDQRSCDLCVRVTDLPRHVSMAHLSSCYLLYCECTRRSSAEKMTIAAAVTDGDSDNLIVGRNGVFYDRNGNDWDATVIKIVENPISIRQAFWGPYKKLVRWVGEMVAKRAAMADSAATTKVQGAVSDAVKPGEPDKAQAAGPVKQKFDVGVIAALGVAVGGITAALGAIMQSIFGLGMWMPLGLVGILLMISGPSVVLAWLKLRQRNLGPLLDANGWAVNARVRINIPFGKALTGMPKLPAGAKRDLTDPFAEAHGKRNFVIVLVIVALIAAAVWWAGLLDPVLPAWLHKSALLGAKAAAPAGVPPAN